MEDIEEVTFHRSASGNGITPCVINDMKIKEENKPGDTYAKATAIDAPASATIVLDYADGELGADMALVDMALSPLKLLTAGTKLRRAAKEFTMLFIRRIIAAVLA